MTVFPGSEGASPLLGSSVSSVVGFQLAVGIALLEGLAEGIGLADGCTVKNGKGVEIEGMGLLVVVGTREGAKGTADGTNRVEGEGEGTSAPKGEGGVSVVGITDGLSSEDQPPGERVVPCPPEEIGLDVGSYWSMGEG